MAITPAKINALTNAITAFKNNIVIAFNRKLTSAQNANNALALEGKTATNIINDAATAIADHAALANPHGVTLESLKTYSSTQITGFLTDKVMQGILPMSLVRVDSPMQTKLDGTWKVSTDNAEILLSGRYVKIPGKVWHPIDDATMNPGTQFYFYVKLSLGVITLHFTAKKLVESNYCMMVGRFQGAFSVEEADIVGFGPGVLIEKIDGIMASVTSAGNAIPVSTNSINETPHLNWV